MPDRTLLDQILLDELQGKNAAIHAYDRIIWTIRSGYVTLFFAAWGILIAGVATKGAQPLEIVKLAVPVWILCVAVSICAWIVDVNYIQRRFRVIESLNAAFEDIVDATLAGSGAERPDLLREALLHFLHIAGDSGGKSYEGKGYRDARRACNAVYVVPSLAVGISLLSYWMVVL